MRRRTALLCACALALLTAPHAGAARPRAAVREPVVALIDTGVNPFHQEFDYRGPSSTVDQFVGWWDFTSERKGTITSPAPGQAWDTAVRDPYDVHGHGTLTASMVGGRTADPRKTPAALPGARLAIAKVMTGSSGTLEGSIGDAVRWATDTIHADVVNISIGSLVPAPSLVVQDAYDAIAAARRKGVLVVVANGNGFANAGAVPGDPGWANWFASSPSVLAVGAAGPYGYLVSTDPEVVAQYSVTGPSNTDNKGYVTESGTSFASPYVAGFAAALVREARLGNHPLTADRLEQLLTWSATDTVTPVQFEGYGVLSAAELPVALAHARAGAMPTRPSPDLNALYVEQVAGSLRTLWSG